MNFMLQLVANEIVKIELSERTKEQLGNKVPTEKGICDDKTVITVVIDRERVPRYVDWRNYGGMILLQ